MRTVDIFLFFFEECDIFNVETGRLGGKNLPTRTSKSNRSTLHNSSFNLYFKKCENDTLTIYRGLMWQTISWRKTVTSLSPAEHPQSKKSSNLKKNKNLFVHAIYNNKDFMIWWEWYQFSHLSLCNKANKPICQYVKLFLRASHGVPGSWMNEQSNRFRKTNAVQYVTPQRCAVKRRCTVSNTHLNFGLIYTTEAFYSSYIHAHTLHKINP